MEDKEGHSFRQLVQSKCLRRVTPQGRRANCASSKIRLAKRASRFRLGSTCQASHVRCARLPLPIEEVHRWIQTNPRGEPPSYLLPSNTPGRLNSPSIQAACSAWALQPLPACAEKETWDDSGATPMLSWAIYKHFTSQGTSVPSNRHTQSCPPNDVWHPDCLLNRDPIRTRGFS